MELEKIRNLSDEELAHHVKTTSEQLFRLRFQVSLGQNDGVKKLRLLRKEIAQIKTVARERELGLHGEAPQAEAAAPAAREEKKPRKAKKAAPAAETVKKPRQAKKAAPKAGAKVKKAKGARK